MRLSLIRSAGNLSRVHKHFINPDIHNLLSQSSLVNPENVHEPSKRKDLNVKTKLLSNEELKSVIQFGHVFTRQKLQMPVILPVRSDSEELKVYSNDWKLQGLIPGNERIVFVDIGLESSSKTRIMVSRNPDGSLTDVSSQDRDRFNQIYFPLTQRKLRVPNMFNEKLIDEIITPDNYHYILDRACVQFEPDDPQFHNVFDKILSNISANAWKPEMGLSQLKHSRYFGLIILDLAIDQNILPLVNFYLSESNYYGIICLFKVYSLIHPDEHFTKEFTKLAPCFEKYHSNIANVKFNDIATPVKNFLKSNSHKKEDVERIENSLLSQNAASKVTTNHDRVISVN